MPGDDFPLIRYTGKGRELEQTVTVEVRTNVYMLRAGNRQSISVHVAGRYPEAVLETILTNYDMCAGVYAFYFADYASTIVDVDGERVSMAASYDINESVTYWPLGEEITELDAKSRLGADSIELRHVKYFASCGYRSVLDRLGIIHRLRDGEVILRA